MTTIRVGHLYPDYLNIYADRGNIAVLARRAALRGHELEVTALGMDDAIVPGEHDLYYVGGGQDREQLLVAANLAGKAEPLKEAVLEGGAALLAVCGGYQLLGRGYRGFHGEDMPGVGLLPLETVAGERRMIGDVLLECELEPGVRQTLAGFENHAGRTKLDPGAEPLGRVVAGFGNDGESGFEGARVGRAIGTYLHGPLLPRNPWLADWLLAQALAHRTGGEPPELEPLADELEARAHAVSADAPARAAAVSDSAAQVTPLPLGPCRPQHLLDRHLERRGHVAVGEIAAVRVARLAAAARIHTGHDLEVRGEDDRAPPAGDLLDLPVDHALRLDGPAALRRVAVVHDDVRDAAVVADAREERHVALAAALEHEHALLVGLDAERVEDEREVSFSVRPSTRSAARARKELRAVAVELRERPEALGLGERLRLEERRPAVGGVAHERELLHPVDAQEDRCVGRVEDLVAALRELRSTR